MIIVTPKILFIRLKPAYIWAALTACYIYHPQSPIAATSTALIWSFLERYKGGTSPYYQHEEEHSNRAHKAIAATSCISHAE